MPEGKSEIPADILNAAAQAVNKMPDRPPFKADVLNAVAHAILAERDKTLGYIDHFIKHVEVEVEGRSRFSISEVNRECNKSMRYVRDQITGDFEQNWLPRPSTEENPQHD